jgi:hypothetical protein
MRPTFAKADIPQGLRLYDFDFGRFGELGLAMNDAGGLASKVVKGYRSRPDKGERDASLCGFGSTRHCDRCGAATSGTRSIRPCGNISSGHPKQKRAALLGAA